MAQPNYAADTSANANATIYPLVVTDLTRFLGSGGCGFSIAHLIYVGPVSSLQKNRRDECRLNQAGIKDLVHLSNRFGWSALDLDAQRPGSRRTSGQRWRLCPHP